MRSFLNRSVDRNVENIPEFISNSDLIEAYWNLEADKVPKKILKRITPVNDKSDHKLREVECTALIALCYGKDVRRLSRLSVGFTSRFQIWNLIHLGLDIDTDIIGDLPDMEISDNNFGDWYPVIYYELEDLRKLCTIQHIMLEGMESKPELELLLVDSYDNHNFYPGKHPSNNETHTLLGGTSIESLASDLLSCGCISKPETFRCVAVDEIDKCWETFGDLVNPLVPSEMLSKESVTKLQKLTDKSGTNNPLTHRIEKIKLYKSRGYQRIEDLKRKYNKAPDLEVCFLKLLDIAFYMRNWKGDVHPTPISRKGDADEGEQLYNVASHLPILYGNSCYITIKDLPLIIYKDGKYRISMDKSEGTTIEERLRIVDEGKHVQSCLHLSSNWIICSAYYYLTMLEHKPPFDPNDLVILKE